MSLFRLDRIGFALMPCLLSLGTGLRAFTFTESDADVFLDCGTYPDYLACGHEDFFLGDFDGDGYSDIGFDDWGPGTSLGRLIFGGSFSSGSLLTNFRRTGFQGYRRYLFPLGTRISMGDVLGDEKEDMVLFSGDSDPPKVIVVSGRSAPPIDIPPPADLTIQGKPGLGQNFGHSLAVGDVNGDGRKDIIIGASVAGGRGEVYVIFGRSSFPSSTVSVTETAHCMTVLGVGGGQLGESVASGDVDGDGIDDIVMADPYKDVGTRTYAGEIYVIHGSTSLPPSWNLQFTPAQWTIIGSTSSFLKVAFATDFTGDGKAELGLSKGNQSILLSGADLLSKGPTIDLVPGQPNSLAPTTFMDPLGRYGDWGSPGDFDGDGRPDLPIRWNTNALSDQEISLYLSHSYSRGASLPLTISSASIRITRKSFFPYDDAALGDFNGDGKSDLVFASPQQDGVGVFYGFWPLENPRMDVQPRDSNQARVHLSVNVDGEPAEMKFTGDILDPVPGDWISFRSKVGVTLTPTLGDKTVTAVFRTSNRRESPSVSKQIPLGMGEGGSSSVTNLLRAGGMARVEARMETGGRLKASVYSREGRLLRVIIDEEKAPGVYVFDWDGGNSDGVRVAPGVYTMVIDMGGRLDRRRVLVK
ncbi:MAG: FG-GAP repeat protein [Elusimicrobia bacterium]|nr:FG-GAP repeat protein [Elusimicrobiota bacterium]